MTIQTLILKYVTDSGVFLWHEIQSLISRFVAVLKLFSQALLGLRQVHKKRPDAYEFSNLNGLLVIVMAILKSISFSDCALLNWQKMLLLFTTYAWIESKLYLELQQYKNFLQLNGLKWGQKETWEKIMSNIPAICKSVFVESFFFIYDINEIDLFSDCKFDI